MHHVTRKFVLAASALALVALVGCTGAPQQSEPSSLGAYPAADMTNYDCAEGYASEYQFVDMTVAQVAEEMDAGSSFVLYCGFDHCPWCNSILNTLNDIALERGITIAYIDTRKDPSWSSNLDIDDYDLFVEKFGSALSEDDDGTPHLYVPHLFFIHDGQLVGDHAGTVPSQENSSDPLTDEQVEEFRSTVNALIDQV